MVSFLWIFLFLVFISLAYAAYDIIEFGGPFCDIVVLFDISYLLNIASLYIV